MSKEIDMPKKLFYAPKVQCPMCSRRVSVQIINGHHRYAVHNKPNGFQCVHSFKRFEGKL